ncbi:ribonuclease H-like domain-containing protein [Tanacetum coccineum]
MDQLRLQFERENLHKVNANTCLQELRIQFMEFFASEEVNSLDRMNQIMQENFKDYLGSEHEIYRSHLLVHLDILEKFIDESVLNYGELLLKESEVKVIKETEKLLNEAIPHEHEIEKSFKLHAKNVQYNSVQAVHESLVVTESSGIKSENNNSENALNKSVNETQMQMQEGKVDMGKALDAGFIVIETSGTESEKHDTNNRFENDTHAEDAYIKPVNDKEPMDEKEVNSRVKIQSPKTRDSTKPVEPTSHTQKPSRQIVTGYRLYPNKSFVGHEKTNTPGSCLRWNPTGRIFNTVGLRWVPTGKIFTSSTTKVDSEPPTSSNEDITNPYECEQTLNVTAGTLNLSAGTSFNPKKERLRVWLLKKLMSKNQVPQVIHKQEQSPNSSQGVEEQQQLAHFDDPCHELLHKVYISQGSSSNTCYNLEVTDTFRVSNIKRCGMPSNLDLVEMMNQRRYRSVSTKDANQKFLRSLPSAWSQVSLIMRTMPGVDSLSFDDMYNNLRVFENDVKGSTASSSSTQNVAFVSENTRSTNDVSTAYGVSNPSNLEQLDEFDLEEMDLKWQVAMISMRMKKFYKKTGRKLQFDAKEPVGFDKTKVECYNCHKTGHFARECRTKGNQDSKRRDAWNSGNKDGRRSGKQEDSKALVTIDGEGVDWTSHSEEEEDFALMACNSSGSDTEVQSCSNECVASYNKLKKLCDEQRAQLSDASIEIKAYTQALKKVEAQLVAHQQGQLWYEEKIRFMKIDLDDKTDVLTYHKKLLAEAEKEKEDLKAKVEKWHNSSKNLSLLQNSQMSANDKFGLGYGDHRYDGILSYENEVLQSVFMNKESDLENQPLYDRFVTAEGMHVVPPPMTGNYMPSGPDIEIDYSQFTYGPKQSQPRSQPKVWTDAPIIEEYESYSDDYCMSKPTKEQEQPSFASTNKQVKTPRETVKNQFTHSKNPKVDKKGLGYGFTTKAYFVCGSLSHLIRDCDFHEKRMAKQVELNKKKIKGISTFSFNLQSKSKHPM